MDSLNSLVLNIDKISEGDRRYWDALYKQKAPEFQRAREQLLEELEKIYWKSSSD